MKSLLVPLVLLCSGTAALAQSFTITASPESSTISGARAEIAINVVPAGGFTGRVTIAAGVLNDPDAIAMIDSTTLEPPYTGHAKAILFFRGPKDGGTRHVLITGTFGSIERRDTVTITLPTKPGVRIYTPESSPLPPGQLAIHTDQAGNGWVWPMNSSEPPTRSVFRYRRGAWSVLDTLSDDARPLALLTEERTGALWFETSRGLARRTAAGAWEIHSTADTGQVSPVVRIIGEGRGTVVSAAADSAGGIWLGVLERTREQPIPHLFRYDGTAWSEQLGGEITAGELDRLIVDRSNLLWVGGTGTVRTFDGVAWKRYTTKELGLAEGATVDALGIDPQNNVWMKVDFNSFGILDRRTMTIRDPDSVLPFQIRLPVTHLKSLDFEPNGNVWIATASAVERFDGTRWNRYTYLTGEIPGMITALRVNEATQSVWVATDNGVAILDLQNLAGTGATRTEALRAARTISSIYPNPTDGTATARLEVRTRGQLRVSIIDERGTELLVIARRSFEPGVAILPFDTSELASGSYFLQVASEQGREIEPITIAR